MGAGTVTTPERCRIALDSGAEFVLTPSVNKDTIEFCLKHAIRILPGVMTPTDVDVCLSYGLNTMKLVSGRGFAGKLHKKPERAF